MGSDRNKPCPCGSGKKLKKCHGLLEDQPNLIDPTLPIDSVINQKINSGRIKQCIHPNQRECSKNIIMAHSIQNNRILKRISRSGELYMVKNAFTQYTSKMKFKLVGRSKASVFTGFCGYHDKLLFQPIEDTDYNYTEQQNFLFAYRAFSFEFHKKMEAQNAARKSLNQKPSLVKNERYNQTLKGYDLAMKDNLKHKEIFDKALLDGDYNIVESTVITYDTAIKFAVCSGFFLEYDIKGNKLNDLANFDKTMGLLMLNIFPHGNKTIVIFSWLKHDSTIYTEFINQILAVTKEEQYCIFNNLIPAYCENAVYNPDFIGAWHITQKNEFLNIYQLSTMSPIEPNKKNLLKPTTFNLFDINM